MTYRKVPVDLDGLPEKLARRPLELDVVHDCVLVADERTPSARMVAKHLDRCEGDHRRVEELLNRRFVLHLMRELTGHPIGIWDTTMAVCDAMVEVARLYAERLEHELGLRFPERSYTVECVGVDDPCEEPSEVYVTAFRSG